MIIIYAFTQNVECCRRMMLMVVIIFLTHTPLNGVLERKKKLTRTFCFPLILADGWDSDIWTSEEVEGVTFLKL